jgi:hypothetical protein
LLEAFLLRHGCCIDGVLLDLVLHLLLLDFVHLLG